MSEMVEKVARSLARAHCRTAPMAFDSAGVPLTWEDHAEIIWPLYQYEARQAIEAMRDPTDAMLRAEVEAYNAVSGIMVKRVGHALWVAMIDAALREGEPCETGT